MKRALFLCVLAATALALGACVDTFDGVFTNPCSESLEIGAYYGESRDYLAGDRRLIIEAELEPLAATRIPAAFEDPGQEPFTVAVDGGRTLVEVDGENRRNAAAGDIMIVIPAEACEG